MTPQPQLSTSSNPSQWLLRVRALWYVLIVFLFFTFLVSIPGVYTMLTTVCDVSPEECPAWGQPTPEVVERLADYRISLHAFALFNLAFFVAMSLICWCAGLFVLRYRSRDWHGLLVSYLLITLAAGGPSFAIISGLPYTDVPDFVGFVAGFITFPVYLSLSLFFLTFPDGRVYPRWTWIGTLLFLVNYAVWLAPEQLNILNWSALMRGAWLFLVYGSHIGIQGYRYRYYYSTEQRLQTKWLVFGYGIALTSTIGFSIFVDPNIGKLLEGPLTTFGFYLPIAAGVTIAILFYRLWDIDIIINRTLVYSVLTTILISIYALIVGALSLLIQDEGHFAISLVGTGVIAVLFQPLRDLLQRTINRLMFGKRDEPMLVISELGKSLEAMLSAEAALYHLAETIASTLKLPYVAIEDSHQQILASSGKRTRQTEHFPLMVHAQIIGTLMVAPRSPGEELNTADRLVLEHVARQASNVVNASRLTDDLQQSRQQILTTREEERRRLRRDLHDGLGPALATLTIQAEAAKEWLSKNPEKSKTLLNAIIEGTQETLADIRRIVYELRPPALDDLGLISAIQEQANHYSGGDLVITVTAPESLPPLPAAVEVAAYRIVQEALTNVTRHAQAHTCEVCLAVNGKMEIEVADNGIGMPVTHRAGVGLNSIYERAAELGGSCVIKSIPKDGTQIRVTLPLGQNDGQNYYSDRR